MEESARKRRRTSPRASGSADPEQQDAPPNESPSRPRPPRRPSWASPTKSSMSRFNPQILERRASASPPKSPSPARSPTRQRQSLAGSERAISAALNAQRRPAAENVQASEPGSGGPSSRAREGESESARPTAQRAGAGGQNAASQGRSPARPSPRPLPPPGPPGEEENPFAGRTLRRSPQTGIRIPPPPEPELPPSVDDPVSSTPPRGIHSSSSPSRRRSKTKEKTQTGSPLKQPPARPGDDEDENTEEVPRKLFKRTGPSRLRQTTVLAETTNNVRKLPAFDANAGKKKERDALHAQLAQLKKDLAVTTAQNERIRAMQRVGRKTPLVDQDKVMEIVRRQLVPQDADSKTKQTQMLAVAALDPMAILPFGKPAAAAVPEKDPEDEISDIKTHHPVPMSAEEELPFLQLFTPFNTSSSLSIMPKENGQPLRQLFTIQLHARDTPGLFGARLEVTVDAMKLSILRLNVAALEPAAKSELGPFLDKICAGDCNRSMERNVGITTWAMAEWLRVAERRGRFWAQLHRETATKQALLEAARNARARKGKRGRNGQELEGSGSNGGPVKTHELLRLIGEQSFDIQVPPPRGEGPSSFVRLSWTIDFDWSGEAQSKVAVMVGVPGKWHQADRKGALGELPSMFQKLVGGGEEPAVAVRKVVALLSGTE